MFWRWTCACFKRQIKQICSAPFKLYPIGRLVKWPGENPIPNLNQSLSCAPPFQSENEVASIRCDKAHTFEQGPCPPPGLFTSSGEQPDSVGLISVTNGGWAARSCRHYHWKEGSRAGRLYRYPSCSKPARTLREWNYALNSFHCRGRSTRRWLHIWFNVLLICPTALWDGTFTLSVGKDMKEPPSGSRWY